MSRFFIDKSVLSYRIRARAEDRNWRGPFAEVAALVDALGSGPSGRKTVGVRVSSSATLPYSEILTRLVSVSGSRLPCVLSVLRNQGVPVGNQWIQAAR